MQVLIGVATVALLATSAAAAAVGTIDGCSVQFQTPVKATFDLSALATISPTGWFSEDDSDPFNEKVDYYYWYNFCRNLPTRPVTRPAGLCSESLPIGNFYQISNSTVTGNDTRCHVISYAQNVSYALYDETNPALGIKQHYGNGERCGGSNDRDIWITVFCKRDGDSDPILGKVSEDNACDYELEVHSLAGCPTECPIVDNKLCDGHGVCGPDGDLNAARCFCNVGYGGDDCTDSVSGSSGASHATSVLVAFVIILTISLLVMAVVLYRKIKRLNADDSQYGQLQDDNNQRAGRAPVAVSAGAVSAASSSSAAPLPAESKAGEDQRAATNLAAAVGDNV